MTIPGLLSHTQVQTTARYAHLAAANSRSRTCGPFIPYVTSRYGAALPTPPTFASASVHRTLAANAAVTCAAATSALTVTSEPRGYALIIGGYTFFGALWEHVHSTYLFCGICAAALMRRGNSPDLRCAICERGFFRAFHRPPPPLPRADEAMPPTLKKPTDGATDLSASLCPEPRSKEVKARLSRVNQRGETSLRKTTTADVHSARRCRRQRSAGRATCPT